MDFNQQQQRTVRFEEEEEERKTFTQNKLTSLSVAVVVVVVFAWLSQEGSFCVIQHMKGTSLSLALSSLVSRNRSLFLQTLPTNQQKQSFFLRVFVCVHFLCKKCD